MAIEHGHDHAGHAHPPAGPVRVERYSDPAQESLNQALRSGFNVLRIILVLLVVAYFGSGIFRVAPGQQGLLVRFGKLQTNDAAGGTPIFGQGWHAALPDPFDEKILMDSKPSQLPIRTFLFEPYDRERDKPVEEMTVPERDQLRPGFDGAMLTGDRNLAHGMWTINYRIDKADLFVKNVGEHDWQFQPILRRVSEDTIIRTVASRTIEQVTREERLAVKEAVKRHLQDRLDKLSCGVTVDDVQMLTMEPGRVRGAFLEVTRAQNDSERQKADANTDRIKRLAAAAGPDFQKLLDAIDAYGAAQTSNADAAHLEGLRAEIDNQLDNAKGFVAVRLRAAQARANAQRETVRREYERFQQYLGAFERDPQVTSLRLWVEMRDTILGNEQNEVFYVPNAGVIEIQTNRDPLRQILAEQKKYLNRETGPPNTDTSISGRPR